MNIFKKGIGRKGQQSIINIIQAIPVIVVLLVVAGLVLSFSGTVLQEFRDTQENGSLAANLTDQVSAGAQTFGNFQTVIWIVAAIVIVIGLLLGVLTLVGVGTNR